MNTLSIFKRKHLIGNFELIFNEAVADSIMYIDNGECGHGRKVNAFLRLESDELCISISDFDELGKITVTRDMSLQVINEKLLAMAAKIQPMNIGTETAIEGFVCKAAPLIAAFQIEVSGRQ